LHRVLGRKVPDIMPAFTSLSMSMKTIFPFACLLALSLSWQSQAQSLQPGKKKINRPATMKSGAVRPSAAKGSDFIQDMEHGQINWTEQYIEAEGSSIMDSSRFKLKNQAKLMAQRGAIVDAQRNLLEIVNGVLVEGQTTVKDLVVESDEVKTKVSGVLKGAVKVGKTTYEDGVATVRLRIPLYADGLAEAVDTTPSPAPTPVPVNPNAPVVQDSLPKTVMLSVSGSYNPRLFPTLTDSQNKIIWDMAQSFDPTKGKALSIIKQGTDAMEAMKGKKGVELLDVAQDQLGNLVLSDKSKARVEKWKKAGLLIWGLVKKLILPV
jgi:hypothetical protein